MYNRERARARDKNQRSRISLETQHENLKAVVTIMVKISGSE